MPVSGLLRNTLTSPFIVKKMLALPAQEQLYAPLVEIMVNFQKMKSLASENHTELHLVKPMLKVLGYTFDSKPKGLEDHVKGPDFALFPTEEARSKSHPLWGSKEYYEEALGILAVKRYGRSLEEGISGFYLEFESRIPVYQLMYLVRTLRVPWGILTNGKRWILLKRSPSFEKRLIEMDLEQICLHPDIDSLHLFFEVFSSAGLRDLLPRLLEEEREELLELLGKKRIDIAGSLSPDTKRADLYPAMIRLCRQFFPDRQFPLTSALTGDRVTEQTGRTGQTTGLFNEQNEADLFTYLFTVNGSAPQLALDEVLLDQKKRTWTKEEFLSLKILDMTPGCGTMAVQLVDALTYLSLTLPYRERNTFVAQWEVELSLNRYIVDTMLYGVERSRPTLDILQNALKGRFHLSAPNYRPGNPLLGISLQDLEAFLEEKKQSGLFAREPREIMESLRSMYRTYSSLSGRIKEDAALKKELGERIAVYRERITDIMDLFTGTYFSKKIDQKQIRELVFNIEGDEGLWQAVRATEWFRDAKLLAANNGFFHMEMEFPFLLNDRFDIIIIQPGLRYLWEDDIDVAELARAHIRRAAAFLKKDGRIVVLPGEAAHDLIPELNKSKKFEVLPGEAYTLLRRR